MTADGAAMLASDLANALNPASVFNQTVGKPDPWQAEVLTGPGADVLLNCSRQSGKSATVAALAVDLVNRKPGSLALLLSPSLRQSGELFRKAGEQQHQAGWQPVVAESALRFELGNGSRLVSLPGTEKTVRGFSAVDLLAIDEAARVDVELYRAVRPMLAVSGGRMLALSTPFGCRGWFYDEWVNGGDAWVRHCVPATDCPRISAEFLAAEKRRMPHWFFAQEYECSFEDSVDAVFRSVDIEAAITGDLVPLWTPRPMTEPDDDNEPLVPLWNRAEEVQQ